MRLNLIIIIITINDINKMPSSLVKLFDILYQSSHENLSANISIGS